MAGNKYKPAAQPPVGPFVTIPLAQYQMLVASHAKLQQINMKSAQNRVQPHVVPMQIPASNHLLQNRITKAEEDKQCHWTSLTNAITQIDTLTPQELLKFGILYEIYENDARFRQACPVLLDQATIQEKDPDVQIEAARHLMRLTTKKELRNSLSNLIVRECEQKLEHAEGDDRYQTCIMLLNIYARQLAKEQRIKELCAILKEDSKNSTLHKVADHYLSLL